MHTILPRGHPFNKAGKEQSFKTCDDNQHWIHVTVFEGDDSLIENCRLLGKVTVDNLPALPAGHASIIVRLSVDGNGVIRVEAHDKMNVSNYQKLEIKV